MSQSETCSFYKVPNESLTPWLNILVCELFVQLCLAEWLPAKDQLYSDFFRESAIAWELRILDERQDSWIKQLRAEKETAALQSPHHKTIVPRLAFLETLLVSAGRGIFNLCADTFSVLHHSAGGLAWRVQQETLHEKAKIKQSKNKTNYSKTTEKIELCFG